MIKVKIIKRNTVLQEALNLDSMGLPKILSTLIREDLERRENQVRLALMLKDESFTEDTTKKLINLLSLPNDDYLFKQVMKYKISVYRKAAKYTQPHYKDAIEGLTGIPTNWRPGMPTPGSSMAGTEPASPTLKNVKGMRKSFKKFVKKNIDNPGMAQDLNKKIDDAMDGIVIDFYNSKIRQNMGGETLMAFLRDHPSNEKALDGMDIKEAIKYAQRYQDEKEDPDKIIIKYEKDGMFWYDIGEASCNIEGERMGHCGNDGRGSLYSLRSKKKNQKISDSHVTISFNEGSEEVYQIKGKNNCTPKAKYGPYVVDFLKKMDVVRVHESGEHSDCDFTEFIEYLEEKHPHAEYGDGSAKVEEAVDAINNGNYNNEHLTFYADDISYDADEPMLRIDANVGFTIQLDFLKDYHDIDFIEELYEDDYEVIKQKIIDECSFEDYDSYSESLDLTLDRQEEIPRLVVNMNLSPYNNDAARDLETAEAAIRSISYGYEAHDIEDHEEKIKKIIYKQFEDVLNPDGREMYKDIIDNIEKLKDSYQYFKVEGDEDSIEFHAEVSLPIKIKGIPNGGRYSATPFNRALNYYERHISIALQSESYAEKLDDLLDIEHKKITADAERQVKIPFKNFDMKEPQEEFKRPFSFNIDLGYPRGYSIRKGEIQNPKIRINLEISNVDNKAQIVFVMQYIKFLEERLAAIINKLNFSQAQARINQAWKDATNEIPNYKHLQESKKKRKINVKIRR